MYEFPLNAWYVAAWPAELEPGGKPIARRLLDMPLVLFRTVSGRAAVMLDRCGHRAMALSYGTVEGEHIQCGYHGVCFDVRGTCAKVPGQDVPSPDLHVRSFPVVEQDGLIWFWPGATDQADPTLIVRYPFHEGPQTWPHRTQHYLLEGNAALVIDNLLDLTHLAFVHRRTIGGNPPDEHATAEMQIKGTPRGVHFVRWLLNSTAPPTYVKAVGFTTRIDRWMDFEFLAPSVVLQFTGALPVGQGAYEEGRREGGFGLRIFHGITPETAHTAHYFWSCGHSFRRDEPEVTDRIFAEIDLTFREDVEVLALQYARLRELGEEGLFNIRQDTARMHAHRALNRLLAAEGRAAQAAE